MRTFRRMIRGSLIVALAFSALWIEPGSQPEAEAASDPVGTPLGHLDEARVSGDETVYVRGWAADPDTADPIYVWVTVDGVGRHLYANQNRHDISAAAGGSVHAFAGAVPASAGRHTVCATASNVGPGVHKSLGCLSVTVPDLHAPLGNFESATAVAGGVVEIKGWALDPDTTDPIYVWVTVDGVGRHLHANQDRPDVDRAFHRGPSHGFLGSLSVSPGEHRVCVTASNVGPGGHTFLGCRTVSTTQAENALHSPFGNFEYAGMDFMSTGGQFRGWVIDPDTTGPIYVWVTIDGVGYHLYANRERSDVGAAYPEYGSRHGFVGTFTGFGHTVCVTASNVGAGSHVSLGCRNAP